MTSASSCAFERPAGSAGERVPHRTGLVYDEEEARGIRPTDFSRERHCGLRMEMGSWQATRVRPSEESALRIL